MASISPNVLMIRRALNGPRATYSVDKHPRLFLAANGNGGGAWRIRYRPYAGGQQCWLTLASDARGVDFVDVVRKAKQLLSQLELEGIDPRVSRPKASVTFDMVFVDWLDRYARNRKKSWLGDQKLYERHIKARLGTRNVRTINRRAVIDVLDEIAKAATPIQANRCQSLISAVFSWALDEGRVETHPALRIRRRGTERSRELVMSHEQLSAFWKLLDDIHINAAIAIKLLLLTGQRLGEVSEAAVSELELDHGEPTWTIPSSRTKNSLRHLVPLAPLSVKLFRQALALRNEDGHPFVFPARRIDPKPLDGNQISRQCKQLFRKIGAPDMRLHDLRHQAATGMAQCGVPLEIRQMVQNQITGRRQLIGARYDQHDYTQEKRRALLLWERKLIEIVDAKEAAKCTAAERKG